MAAHTAWFRIALPPVLPNGHGEKPVEDSRMGWFIVKKAILGKFIPSMGLWRNRIKKAFAKDVLERFLQIHLFRAHELKFYCLNSISKFKVRVASLLTFLLGRKNQNLWPQNLDFGL